MSTVHSLVAYNSARASDNPLHNDEAARKLGYRAGMVAGVDMYGYMTYAAVRRWGIAWLQGGAAECQLLKPVFEGDTCDVVTTAEATDKIEVELKVSDTLNATASFSKTSTRSTGGISPSNIPSLPLPAERPKVSQEAFAVGTILGTVRRSLTKEQAGAFLADVRDDLPVYTEQQIVHPAFLLRMCNFVFSQNVALGPWIHTASRLVNLATVPVGSTIDARGEVVANYEKRGHLFAEVDINLIVDDKFVASTIRHIAIYQPRSQ